MRVPALPRPGPGGLRGLAADFSRSDTGRAAGLGIAVIMGNVMALIFTVIFARALGASGYGSLAALLSAFIILMVPGSALQVAAAREVSRELAAGSRGAGSEVRSWLRRLALATVIVAIVAIPLRGVIGAIINVDDLWAAAAVPVTAMLWMILAVERGVLQGHQRYKDGGAEYRGRGVVAHRVRRGAGGGGPRRDRSVPGERALLLAVALVLLVPLSRQLHGAEDEDRKASRLRDLLSEAWVPVIGLTLLFALQELHIIIVKHEATDEAAGAYAVAAVAGKAIIWVAVGLGMYLLPEAARRAETGVDARPILLKTLGLIAAASVPMVLIYAVAGRPLLKAVFGEDLTAASDALPWLGLAMAMLACAYLSVQYLLAMGRASFIWVLGRGGGGGGRPAGRHRRQPDEVALALFAVQVFCATATLTLSFRQTGRATRSYVPV